MQNSHYVLGLFEATAVVHRTNSGINIFLYFANVVLAKKDKK